MHDIEQRCFMSRSYPIMRDFYMEWAAHGRTLDMSARACPGAYTARAGITPAGNEWPFPSEDNTLNPRMTTNLS